MTSRALLVLVSLMALHSSPSTAAPDSAVAPATAAAAPGAPPLFAADRPELRYQGRIDFATPAGPRLSGAGAYVEIRFRGSGLSVILQDQPGNGQDNYVVVVVDGAYHSRFKLAEATGEYELASSLSDGEHTLLLCKATEAGIGWLEFDGVRCEELLPNDRSFERRIEFIGDSITAGTGVDLSQMPCEGSTWYDQHNAYLAYGPLLARRLGADWLLSAISGAGVTRHWNAEEPTVPGVYDHLYENAGAPQPFDSSGFAPDLVSICLGTNDFSDGDGSYDRPPLDGPTFVTAYVAFIRSVRARYPGAPICLLTSPLLDEAKNAALRGYLDEVRQRLEDEAGETNVYLFAFATHYGKGCTGHPDAAEMEEIADELEPFFRSMMGWSPPDTSAARAR